MVVRAFWLKFALALFAFTAFLAANPAGAVTTTVKGVLAGPVLSGYAPTGSFKFTDDATNKTLYVSIFRVKLAANTVLTVRVGATVAGTIKIKVNGGGGVLDLRTRDGETVPVVTTGSVITVKKADGTLVLTGPQTGTRDWSMRAPMSGPKIDGKKPAGSATYTEGDYTYSRKLRVLAWNIKLAAGTELELYLNTNLLGGCTVSSAKVCTITETLLDSESVQHLTTSSVLKLKKKVGLAVVLTTGTWH